MMVLSTPSASPASPPMRTQGPNRSFWNTTRPTSANPPLFRSEPCIAECLRQKEDRAQPENSLIAPEGQRETGRLHSQGKRLPPDMAPVRWSRDRVPASNVLHAP